MPTTTVKVETSVRDRLLVEARRDGSTVGQLLDAMLRERERSQRFAQLREAIAATPSAARKSWQAETEQFDVTSTDGLDDA